MSVSSAGPGVLDAQGFHVHFHLAIPPQFTEALMGTRPLRLFPDPPPEGSPPVSPSPAGPELAAPGSTPGAASPPNWPIASKSSPALKLHAAAASPLPAADAARRALDALAVPEPDVLPVLESAERETAAALSLAAYYDRHLSAWRDAQVASGALKASSRQTERDHVRAFGRWDAVTPPPNWPRDVAWPGCPLSHLSGARLRDFFLTAVDAGNAGTTQPWRPRTALSCWSSLRGVLTFAQRQGAIAAVPQLPRLKRAIEELNADADDSAVPYSDAELGRLYAVLPEVVAAAVRDGTIRNRVPARLPAIAEALVREMRAALLLCANTGPRRADLFLFEFGKHVKLDGDGPPEVSFVADKTGKRHRIPLADVTVRHLLALRRAHAQLPSLETPLFPHLVNARAKHPLDSDPMRRCCELLRSAVRAIGLDERLYPKPWHAVRKSCTTRFNAHGVAHGMGLVGKLITHGRDSDVAAQSYDSPLPIIAKAVSTIGWPAEILAGAEELARN